MKSSAIIRICIYSLLLVLLIALLLGGLTRFGAARRRMKGGADSHAEYRPRQADGFANVTSFASSEVGKLDIDWAAGDILIQKGDVDAIDIREESYGSSKPMVITQKNGTLKIEFSNREYPWVGISHPASKDLTVTVPRDFRLRELDLDVASSRVTIAGMTIDEIEFDGADGELALTNCTVQELDIDTASGDVTFSGSLDTLDMDGASTAFVGVFQNQPHRLVIDGMSGSLDVTLPKDTGFTASVDGMSCKFNSELPVTGQNGTYVCGDGAVKIDADGMSVRVTVRYAE